jgi:S-DNA-T family DNA segregation ATPase FtsK/SpoIIIE
VIGRRVLRPDGRPPSLRFRPPSIHIPLWLMAVGWLVALTWRGLRWLAVHRRTAIVLGTALWLALADLVLEAAVLLLVVAGAGCLWWAASPDTFRRLVLARVQLWLREWFTYRRNWQPAMLTCGLTLRESWGGDIPTLRRVTTEDGRDLLRVRMLDGQTAEQWQAAAPALASTFGVRAVRIRRTDRPRELVLVVALRNGGNRHVTDRTVEADMTQVPTARGAFPRQPRGGAA